MTVPIATSPGRSGFGPQLSLSYDSGSGNGAFGIGWKLSLPSITRKTDKGLPKYRDSEESDVFILSDAEDLVPCLEEIAAGEWQEVADPPRTIDGNTYIIRRYRPRVEGLFARIERWTNQTDVADTRWRTISRDNVTSWYGKTDGSRIADPDDASRIFSWLICESYDDKGNAMVYRYVAENSENVDPSQVHEANRTGESRSANRYLKQIQYGNKTSRLIQPDLAQMEWLFELVLDYGEGHYQELDLDPLVPEAEQHRLVRAALDVGQQNWPVRPDPLSSYRAGFEVRTYRRCRRALMFHLFTELGTEPYLVRSTEFHYDDLDYTAQPSLADELAHQGSTRFASHIRRIIQSGHVHHDRQPVGETDIEHVAGIRYVSYIRKSMPPLEFEYSKATIERELRSIDAEDLANLPQGLDDGQYRWVDLDGEGAGGILTEQGGAWFYKRNVSPLPSEDAKSKASARFAPAERVTPLPSFSDLSGGGQQLLDLAGDGQVDLVSFDGPVPGYFERDSHGGWQSFRPFTYLPNIDWADSNLSFVDLTGDGLADILLTEDDALTWYPSLGEKGFTSGEKVRQALDEESGPKLVLADGTQSVYLADLSGDGLTDLARIRNGEVCYWPNLGYGRFGAKVTMGNGPDFDAPDQFDQRRVRLADIDGSGVTDIIYLKDDGVYLYFNESGNSWSPAEKLIPFPKVDNLSSVLAVDLLGNGTACLVWSSASPAARGEPLRYLDLMGGQKPHLLVKTVNNLGAETRIHYASSTKFYLQDKQAGNPWITRLHFPVQVVERVETCDRVSRNRFASRYAYHHGCYDGTEREFRGFGMVERMDTEEFAALNASDEIPDSSNLDAASNVPPVLTRTWFHTGTYLRAARIGLQFKDAYYREPGLNQAELDALLLPDTILPTALTLEEERQAARTLKGSILRQEVYGLDGTDKASHPYRVSERNYDVKTVQPQSGNLHAVFFVHPRESIEYQYERDPTDARVGHKLTLEVDDFGNVLKAADVGYGRKPANVTLAEQRDRDKQTTTRIMYTETVVTNPIHDAAHPHLYRAPLPCETRSYELTGYTPTGNAGRFRYTDFVQPDPNDAARFVHVFDNELGYEATPAGGRQRRLIEQLRTLYRKDDLGGLLGLGKLEPLALPGESYKLAFTSGLLNQIYVRNSQGLLPANPADVLRGGGAGKGGYVLSQDWKGLGLFPSADPDDHWWIPAGRIFYSPDGNDNAVQELAHGSAHFFLPLRYRDPFYTGAVSTESLVTYDPYDLLVMETKDAADNTATATNDYRVLQPEVLTGPNGNRSVVLYDVVGLVTGTALMGKAGENLGDELTSAFRADLTEAEIDAFMADPHGEATGLLAEASTRIVYDLHRFRNAGQPALAAVLARETHASEPVPPGGLKIQIGITYSDGFGREIQQKIQAEPGALENAGLIVNPRWVSTGWIIFNNKGKPVRQYEPFFDNTHEFRFDNQAGVSPVLFYDPAGRVVATLHPEHSYSKKVFDPWRQETWDRNDTVTQTDPRQDSDVGAYFTRLPEADFLPSWFTSYSGGSSEQQQAATKAATHAGTPTVGHFDVLGRPFLTIAHNRFERNDTVIEEHYENRAEFDIEGNEREIIDARGRVVMRYDYDMRGNRIHQASMEAGERWLLNDITGKPIRTWDARGCARRTTYDRLRRPLELFIDEGNGEWLAEKTVYGESQGEASNHRGRIYQVYDGAGLVTNEAYDFKGNLLRGTRQLVAQYKTAPDWSGNPGLQPESFVSETSFDAFNRPVALGAPDGTVLRPAYNEANLLDKLEANLRGDSSSTSLVNNIDYDAKGRRVRLQYSNSTLTEYEYDAKTFRLIRLKTTRTNFPAAQRTVQDLRYTYDPAGNITHIRDDADIQNTVFFKNRRVEPSADYIYDAVYRLIEASGREHLGLAGDNSPLPPKPAEHSDAPRVARPHPGDGNAMGIYTQQYIYDEVGNFLEMIHRGSDPTHPGWSREYQYAEPSLLDISTVSNRLSSTSRKTTNAQPVIETHTYDEHGNMLSMPHLPSMRWNHNDEVRATSRQVVETGGTPETTYYVYDAAGQRVRKVRERQAPAGQTPTRVTETIYLGGFEINREYNGNGETRTLERGTVHVMDNEQRIALVETKIFDAADGGEIDSPVPAIRYQLGNYLGSASLELDKVGAVISYEEYYPYGSTSYQAGRNTAEASRKQYRYTGKERDTETGFYYHGARYYAAWIARWISADPSGLTDGMNLYRYVRNNPIGLVDDGGFRGKTPSLNAQQSMWQKELTGWQKREAEINSTYKRGSTQWNRAMAHVRPRIEIARRRLSAVQTKIDELAAARWTKRMIEDGTLDRELEKRFNILPLTLKPIPQPPSDIIVPSNQPAEGASSDPGGNAGGGRPNDSPNGQGGQGYEGQGGSSGEGGQEGSGPGTEPTDVGEFVGFAPPPPQFFVVGTTVQREGQGDNETQQSQRVVGNTLGIDHTDLWYGSPGHYVVVVEGFGIRHEDPSDTGQEIGERFHSQLDKVGTWRAPSNGRVLRWGAHSNVSCALTTDAMRLDCLSASPGHSKAWSMWGNNCQTDIQFVTEGCCLVGFDPLGFNASEANY